MGFRVRSLNVRGTNTIASSGLGRRPNLLDWLVTSRAILLQCSPDPLNDVRGLGNRIIVLLEKATLYFCCLGGGASLCTEGAFRVSIYCNDSTWTGHFELEISIMRHRVEFSERGSSEHCVVGAAEGGDIED